MPVSSLIPSVDTIQIRPASEAFACGDLVMSNIPSEAVARSSMVSWSGDTINEVLIITFTILCILSLRRIVEVLPYIFKGISRLKWIENLEDSMRLSRERNTSAAILSIPLCLIFSRYEMYSPDIIEGLPPGLKTLAIIGAFLAYFIIRVIIKCSVNRHKADSSSFQAAFRCWDNFIILATTLLISADAFLYISKADLTTFQNVSYYITGFAGIVYLLREFQFLTKTCNQLAAFLYLCTLEILPAGLLVASAVLL